MAGRPGTGRARARGTIDALRSGSLRVRVHAGVDPVTGKRHDLVEVVPPGPKGRRQAEATLARFLREIEEERNPRTTATVDVRRRAVDPAIESHGSRALELDEAGLIGAECVGRCGSGPGS
jgi:hypothetical protein